MANPASPSIRVHKTSATLTRGARTWDQIGTVAHARKATMGTAKCASQWTPARLTLETALRTLQCADTMGLGSLTASVGSTTTTLYLEWGVA